MAKPPFTDKNLNGYPDQYERQEQELMNQITTRRKIYMDRYGRAERSYREGQGGLDTSTGTEGGQETPLFGGKSPFTAGDDLFK